MRKCNITFVLVALAFLGGCADVDKGLYSVSDAVAPTDRVTGQRSLNFVPRAQQIQQSDQIGEKIIKQYTDAGKPINEEVDTAQYERLQRVFNRVHSVSHLSDEDWKAYLLPDNQWNAFTNGGTYIFVYKKLMNDIKSDDELAAIIGHEIGHVSANHVYEKQSYILGASLKRKGRGARNSEFQNAFTEKQEEEADELGVLYAALAGYDPYAASRVWKKIYQQQGNYLSNHPTNGQRYKKTQELADQYKKYYIPGKINPQHAEILRAIALNNQPAEQLKPGEGGGLAAVLETTADVLNKHYEAKAEELNQRGTRQFIQYISQTIVPLGRRLVDAHTFQFIFAYRGSYPIKDLNLTASVGTEQAFDHTENIIQPNSNLTAEFKFENADLSLVNINQIPIIVAHAERP